MKASNSIGRAESVHCEAGVDGIPGAEICCLAGISQAADFNWRKKYDGLLPTDTTRLRQIEDENASWGRRRMVSGTRRSVGRDGPWNSTLRHITTGLAAANSPASTFASGTSVWLGCTMATGAHTWCRCAKAGTHQH